MSRQIAMPANGEFDLSPDAELAAKGDDTALDRLFAALGGSAWGLGFAAADAVGPATDAVAKGFAELLQLFDNGLNVADVRMELLRATRTIALESVKEEKAGDNSFEGAHAREPLTLLGETKDRQATLAFTALSEPMRSSLWLVEAEGLSITKTSQLLGETHKATEDLVRHARASFRAYYVDAVKRDGLGASCQTTLDKLAAYVGRSLAAGDVAAVEHHLAEDKECRSIVMKLDDLEGRLHAAIPPLPAWTRQLVADTWSTYVPIQNISVSREPEQRDEEKRRPVGALIGLVAVAAAAAVVLLGTGVFNSSSPAKSTTQAASVTTIDDNAVATPTVVPAPSTTSTTVAEQTSTTVAPVPTTEAATPATQAPVASTPTTARRRVTATTAAPRPTTTVPNTGFTLVTLPPTPITH